MQVLGLQSVSLDMTESRSVLSKQGKYNLRTFLETEGNKEEMPGEMIVDHMVVDGCRSHVVEHDM